MSSFLEFMQRMVQGKPVFDDPHASATVDGSHAPVETPSTTTESKSSIIKGQEHTYPVIEVRRVVSRVNGSRLQVYGWLENTWDGEIMLDKIRLLNTTRELDASLRSHQQKELLLYDGPKPTHEEHEAEIDYKTYRDGDYFRGVYRVGFEYDQDDKTYSVDGLDLHEPVQDIYE